MLGEGLRRMGVSWGWGGGWLSSGQEGSPQSCTGPTLWTHTHVAEKTSLSSGPAPSTGGAGSR